MPMGGQLGYVRPVAEAVSDGTTATGGFFARTFIDPIKQAFNPLSWGW
jgi:hypothetical protein